MQENEDSLSFQVISNPNEIISIKRDWNKLVDTSCNNPFLYCEFVKEFFKLKSKFESPLILIIYNHDKLVGIAPLVSKTKFGIRSASFSNPSWCSNFIIDKQFMDTIIPNIIDFLFKTLNYKYADFVLSHDSPECSLLIEHCKARRIHVKNEVEMGRRIVPINCTYSEFLATQKKKDRKEMRRVERILFSSGSVNTVCVDGNSQPDVVIKKILDVEGKSWKAKYRARQGEDTDEILMIILRASQLLSKESSFRWKVWFLELDGKTIAYCIDLQCGEKAFLTKTSYDEHYKKLNPGIFLQNTIVREYFNNEKIKLIDFLSDLPFLKAWSNQCIPRTRIILTQGIIPTIKQNISQIAVIRKIADTLFS